VYNPINLPPLAYLRKFLAAFLYDAGISAISLKVKIYLLLGVLLPLPDGKPFLTKLS